jgi:hypothetical protein
MTCGMDRLPWADSIPSVTIILVTNCREGLRKSGRLLSSQWWARLVECRQNDCGC